MATSKEQAGWSELLTSMVVIALGVLAVESLLD